MCTDLYNLSSRIRTGDGGNTVQTSPVLEKGTERAGPLRSPTTLDQSEQVSFYKIPQHDGGEGTKEESGKQTRQTSYAKPGPLSYRRLRATKCQKLWESHSLETDSPVGLRVWSAYCCPPGLKMALAAHRPTAHTVEVTEEQQYRVVGKHTQTLESDGLGSHPAIPFPRVTLDRSFNITVPPPNA